MFKGRGEIEWKNARGERVAVETRAKRAANGTVTSLARLDVKVSLEQLELDLLVTGWCARIWLEIHSAPREHISLGDVKRILENSHTRMPAGMSM